MEGSSQSVCFNTTSENVSFIKAETLVGLRSSFICNINYSLHSNSELSCSYKGWSNILASPIVTIKLIILITSLTSGVDSSSYRGDACLNKINITTPKMFKAPRIPYTAILMVCIVTILIMLIGQERPLKKLKLVVLLVVGLS